MNIFVLANVYCLVRSKLPQGEYFTFSKRNIHFALGNQSKNKAFKTHKCNLCFTARLRMYIKYVYLYFIYSLLTHSVTDAASCAMMSLLRGSESQVVTCTECPAGFPAGQRPLAEEPHRFACSLIFLLHSDRHTNGYSEQIWWEHLMKHWNTA